eukprot:gene10738-7467_t
MTITKRSENYAEKEGRERKETAQSMSTVGDHATFPPLCGPNRAPIQHKTTFIVCDKSLNGVSRSNLLIDAANNCCPLMQRRPQGQEQRARNSMNTTTSSSINNIINIYIGANVSGYLWCRPLSTGLLWGWRERAARVTRGLWCTSAILFKGHTSSPLHLLCQPKAVLDGMAP